MEVSTKGKVYIASPYTVGNTAHNIRMSVGAAEDLRAEGYLPFVPLLNHLWHLMSPHPGEYWMGMDFEWVLACDAVVRLPGISEGADREVALAREKGIPVFYGVDDFLDRVVINEENR